MRIRITVNRENQWAFSLVELLVVVVVISIIATIALPNILNSSSAARSTVGLRNAQSVATSYNIMAEAYREAFRADPPFTTVEEAIEAIGEGIIITNSHLGIPLEFSVPGVSVDNTATNALELVGGRLRYNPPN
jgi:prepilin-type N-terminal cleavage/methylation domain-containing protein